jgi:hypothetical protein
MGIALWICIGLLVLLAVVAGLFLRRQLISRRGGIIEVSLRLSTMVRGRGWAPGFARFDRDELRWFRMFSFSARPRRVLPRAGLAVESRRVPDGAEHLVLPDNFVVLRCTSGRAPIEIAMATQAVTGFLSWLEAAPPVLR